MLKGTTNIAWQLKDTILETTKLLAQANCGNQRYREANHVVDALAKWSIEELHMMVFSIM